MNPGELLKFWNSYEGLARNVEVLRQDTRDWCSWCFLPTGAWFAAIAESPDVRDHQMANECLGFCAAVGTWRYSQGVYRFDPDVYNSIIESGFSGNIPCDVLKRLPEWCVYIETPGMPFLNGTISGCFVYLDDSRIDKTQSMKIALLDDDYVPLEDGPGGLITLTLPMGDWSVEEAYEKFLGSLAGQRMKNIDDQAKLMTAITNIYSTRDAGKELVKKILALVLYICSEEPDIVDRKEPEYKPGYPRPKVVKGRLRYFPAKRQHIYDVGQKIGNELRQAKERIISAPTGRTVSDHFRRAHWHGYWIGARKEPREGERKFILKWLPPTFVHGRKDELEDFG